MRMSAYSKCEAWWSNNDEVDTRNRQEQHRGRCAWSWGQQQRRKLQEDHVPNIMSMKRLCQYWINDLITCAMYEIDNTKNPNSIALYWKWISDVSKGWWIKTIVRIGYDPPWAIQGWVTWFQTQELWICLMHWLTWRSSGRLRRWRRSLLRLQWTAGRGWLHTIGREIQKSEA